MRRTSFTVVASALFTAGLTVLPIGARFVEAGAFFRPVAGTTSDPRIAIDASTDGRFVLTRGAIDRPAAVADRSTSLTVQLALPAVAFEASAMSGDGARVAFTTVEALLPADTDALEDVYTAEVLGGAIRLMTPGMPGERFAIAELDHSGGTAVVGTASERVLVADGVSMLEIGVDLGPAPAHAASISGDGRYVTFTKDACVSGAGCSARHIYRFDRTTGISRPVARDAAGVAVTDPALIEASADGGCIAYATLTPLGIWKDCAFVPGSPFQVSSSWTQTTGASRLSISPDGDVVGWLQSAPSIGTLGIVEATQAYVRVGTTNAFVATAATGQLPTGQATGLVAIRPDLVFLNVESNALAPGDADAKRVIVRVDQPREGSTAFTPRTPVRIVDSRIGLGSPSGTLRPGTSIRIPMRGLHGVPTTATAVAVQLTATEGTGTGFVGLVSTGTFPGLTSNLNIDSAGETIANSAVVPIGPDGSITLYSSAQTHVIVDLSGWWTPVAQVTSAGRFQRAGPQRVLDTRPESRLGYDGSRLDAGSVTVLQITGRSGVPTRGVGAVVLNVTIADTQQAGYVQVSAAADLVKGASSTVNAGRPGQVIAASTIVPVDALGRVAIHVQASTHLVVDLIGWFTNADAAPGSDGLFVAWPQVGRVLDTREPRANWAGPKPTPRSRVDLLVAETVVGNITVTESDGAGFVQVGGRATLVPGASSTINPTAVGETIANAFISPVDGGGLGVYVSNGTHVAIDMSGVMTD